MVITDCFAVGVGLLSADEGGIRTYQKLEESISYYLAFDHLGGS